MTVTRSILLFVLAAVAEIGGAWLVWQGIREQKGWAWVGAGVIALGLYGFVATFQPDAHFGRILAAYGGVFADAAAFNKQVKVLFLGIGSAEGPGTKTFSEQLTQAGIKNVYYESPGTAHEWLTWRRCFKEFAPLLFR